MNYSSLLAEVYTLTKRPDLVAETTLGVKSATLQLHRMDFFSKDLHETGIAFDTSEYIQTLTYRVLLPRFRQMKYLRKYDNTGGAAGEKLKEVSIEKILDGYKQERTDIFYLAGDVIQIKSSTKEKYYLFGCYLNPSIDPDNFISWVADEYPYAIIYRAASIVMKAIGQDTESAAYDNLAKLEANEILISNLETVGA